MSTASDGFRRVFVHNFEGGDEMTGFIEASANLDGIVTFTDEDGGQVHHLKGWLWAFEDPED